MAVSISWGPFLGVLVIGALSLWVYIRAANVWKLPYGQCSPQRSSIKPLNLLGVVQYGSCCMGD